MLERRYPDQFAAQIHALLSRPNAVHLLAAIRCLTLILCGADDAWSPPAQHRAMQAAISGATLCLVEHSGHMSTVEQSNAVSAAMAAWLARG